MSSLPCSSPRPFQHDPIVSRKTQNGPGRPREDPGGPGRARGDPGGPGKTREDQARGGPWEDQGGPGREARGGLGRQTLALGCPQVAEPQPPKKKKGEIWKDESITMRSSIGMPAQAKPWSKKHELTGVTVEREKDVVDVAWWVWAKKQKGAMRRGTHKLWVDVSQQVSRTPWSAHLPTNCTRSKFYSFELDIVINQKDLLEHVGACYRVCVDQVHFLAEFSPTHRYFAFVGGFDVVNSSFKPRSQKACPSDSEMRRGQTSHPGFPRERDGFGCPHSRSSQHAFWGGCASRLLVNGAL